MADPYYANVALLLPMNGADNGTVFTDYSPTPKTITRYGDTKTVTAQSKYYGSSGYFDGAGDSLTAPATASTSGTGDFSWEAWLRPSTIASGYRVWLANDTSGGFSSAINSNGTITFGRSLIVTQGTTSNAVTFNAWNHVSFSRVSGVLKVFIGGEQGYSDTITTNYAAGVVRIGTDGMGSALPYTGYLQDIRSTQEVGRYTTNFTPPGALIAPQVSGTILDTAGLPCARTVHLFDRASGTKLGTTVSDASTGQYAFYGPPGGNEVIRVVLADEPTLYNDIIDRILPA